MNIKSKLWTSGAHSYSRATPLAGEFHGRSKKKNYQSVLEAIRFADSNILLRSRSNRRFRFLTCKDSFSLKDCSSLRSEKVASPPKQLRTEVAPASSLASIDKRALRNIMSQYFCPSTSSSNPIVSRTALSSSSNSCWRSLIGFASLPHFS